jgi:hypothetical protein
MRWRGVCRTWKRAQRSPVDNLLTAKVVEVSSWETHAAAVNRMKRPEKKVARP